MLATKITQKITGDEVVPTTCVPRIFTKMLGGDPIAAMLLSQICYWTEHTNSSGWFYKSASDWEEELGITKRQLPRLLDLLKEVGVITEIRMSPQGSLTTYYKLDQQVLEQALTDYTQSNKTSQSQNVIVTKCNSVKKTLVQNVPSHSDKTSLWHSDKMLPSITEITNTKITTKITEQTNNTHAQSRTQEIINARRENLAKSRLTVEPSKLELAVKACTALITVDGKTFVNGISHNRINDIVNRYDPDSVVEACNLTGNRASLDYMEKILEHWQAHGKECTCKKPSQATAYQQNNNVAAKPSNISGFASPERAKEYFDYTYGGIDDGTDKTSWLSKLTRENESKRPITVIH